MKFTIEPDALSTARASDIRNLLKSWWEPYGILVFPVKILKDSAINCTPAVKDLLKKSYSRFRSGGDPLWQELDHIDWDSMAKPTDLEDYHSKFELALIEETRALEFGFPPPITQYFGDIEAAKLTDVSESAKFEAVSQLAHRNIRKNTRIDTIWKKRFSRLAEVSKEVTIVDRYAAWNFYDGNRKVELSKLFKFLDQDSRGCKVTIYSDLDGGRYTINPDDIADALLVEVRDLHLTNSFKPSRFIADTKAIEQAFLNAADNTVHLAFRAGIWSIV